MGNTVTGQARFGESPDEKKVKQLEALKEVIEKNLEIIKDDEETVLPAVERLKMLLMAPDKKAKILEMASNNEIDEGLVELLKVNVQAAEEAGETQKAEFMQKVITACQPWV